MLSGLPDLYFLRHGESTWNAEGRVQGQKDVPLTARGYDHASAQGRLLAGLALPPDTPVLSSPLERARETARVACTIAGLPPPQLDDRLMEMGFGPWEGQLKTDLKRAYPALATRRLFEVCMEGPGESYSSLRDRCAAVLHEIDRPTVIVSHGIALTMIRGLLRGLEITGMAKLDRPQGVIIAWRKGCEALLSEPGAAIEGPAAI